MNILTPFEYFAPETLDEALELLATKENAKVLAGGTDLMIQLKEKMIHPANVIDVTHIPELNEFKVEDGKGAVLGACTTDAFCEFSEELKAKYPAFAYAAGEIGGPQVREMGTIGGNLANSGPSAETPASLICYGADVVLVKKGSERRRNHQEHHPSGTGSEYLCKICLCRYEKLHGNRYREHGDQPHGRRRNDQRCKVRYGFCSDPPSDLRSSS